MKFIKKIKQIKLIKFRMRKFNNPLKLNKTKIRIKTYKTKIKI